MFILTSIKCIEYKDPFIELSGCFNDTTANFKLLTKESLNAVITTKHKRKFLWFKWGMKVEELYVVSKNKNTIITKVDYVVINK